MRLPALQESLRCLAVDAAAALADELSAGAELSFELTEQRGRSRSGVPLYCYRPLTGDFISERTARLRSLPSYAPARRVLEQQAGLESYLLDRGRTAPTSRNRDRAHEAITTFLARLFEERTEFDLDPARFDAAYAELEHALVDGRCFLTMVAPLHGLELDTATTELALGEGLSILRAERLAEPPPELARDEHVAGTVVVAYTVEVDRGAVPPFAEVRARFQRLLSALRLYERGAYRLGSLAWVRRDAGVWRAAPLGGSGPGGPAHLLPAEQEDELRAFCNLIQRRAPRSGELAWALGRFEMGRERLSPLEALSDYLLALRALLEPEGPASGRLAQRLATICAMPGERAALAERIAAAVELERAVICGSPAGSESGQHLVEELGEHLRAVLRDTLCGHLDEDLVGVADEILAEAAEADPAPAGAR